MWNIGQVLYDRATDTPVIFCGFVLECDETQNLGTYIYREGDVRMEIMTFGRTEQLTHYLSRDDDKSVTIGTFAVVSGYVGQYFGVLSDDWLSNPSMVDDAIRALHDINLIGTPHISSAVLSA